MQSKAHEHTVDEYNAGHTHEALHAAYLVMDMWDRHVVDTWCAEQFADVREAVERAHKAIFDAYQAIGQHSD